MSQQAKTGIPEAEQRRKQYQAGVEVTGTGSEFQGQQSRVKHRDGRKNNAQNVSQGKQDFALGECLCAAFM